MISTVAQPIHPSQFSSKSDTEKPKKFSQPISYPFNICRAVQKLTKLHFFDSVDKQQFINRLQAYYPGTHLMQINDHLALINKPREEKELIRLYTVNLAEKCFTKGGVGKVYFMQAIDNKQELVVKLSRKKITKKNANEPILLPQAEKEQLILQGTPAGAKAKKELISEFHMMNYIKENVEDTTGLNCDAYGSFEYKNQGGMIVNKFDYDGLAFLDVKTSRHIRYRVMNQLIFGLDTLHEIGIVHRDIKLGNILLKKLQSEKGIYYQANLSDFGSASFINELFKFNTYPEIGDILGRGTVRTTSFKIVERIKQLLIDLKKHPKVSINYHRIASSIISELKLSDQFSLGLALFSLWTKKEPPFDSYENNEYLRFNSNLDEIEDLLNSACLYQSKETSKRIVDTIMVRLEVGL